MDLNVAGSSPVTRPSPNVRKLGKEQLMARLLSNEPEEARAGSAKKSALTIGGVRYTHAAAQFWAALLSEVASDFPGSNIIILETLSGTVLSRELLFPEIALQRELDQLTPAFRLEAALKEALEEFDLYGAPGAVALRLLAGDRETKHCELPLDCVDNEIFAYLLAWLLEWAELPESQWNDERLSGAFQGRDLTGTADGSLQFEFERKHISEELYHWRLLLRCSPGNAARNSGH